MKTNKLRNQILWVGSITFLLTALAAAILPTISERAARRQTVLAELTRIWGAPQVITGPIASGNEKTIDFLEMQIEGDFKTSTRRKGIYKFPFYSARLDFSGKIKKTGAEKIQFNSRARLRVEKAALGFTELTFSEALENGIYVYRAYVPKNTKDLMFKMTLACESLQSLNIFPAAAQVGAKWVSDWRDPSFIGDFLPLDYTVNKRGFVAEWKIQGAARKLVDITTIGKASGEELLSGAFGVAFYQPVDIYQATERSVKYAFLFIALTLAVLLLFEILSSAEIHPMQYLLAGSALVIFYLLLLALSEFLGFSVAYWIAASGSVALLSRYCTSFLLCKAHVRAFTLTLALLYGLLYAILQLEEAALLAGALTLFAALGFTMYLTRNLNWYAVGSDAAS